MVRDIGGGEVMETRWRPPTKAEVREIVRRYHEAQAKKPQFRAIEFERPLLTGASNDMWIAMAQWRKDRLLTTLCTDRSIQRLSHPAFLEVFAPRDARLRIIGRLISCLSFYDFLDAWIYDLTPTQAITQALEDLKARRTPLLVNISLVWLLVNVAVVLVLVAAEAPDPPSS